MPDRAASTGSDLHVLLAAARSGDGDAWAELVDRFQPLIHSITRQFRLSAADADDVGQTVWLRLLEHLGQLREDDALPGWIATTTKRSCLTLIDRQRRSLSVDPSALTRSSIGEPVDDTDAPDSEMIREEARQAVREGLAELAPRHRDLLGLLAQTPPVPYVQISERLGLPIGSIGPSRGRSLHRLESTDALRRLMAEESSAVTGRVAA